MQPTGQGPDRRLTRAQRVRATADFQAAYAQKRCWRGRCMVLWVRRGEGAAIRLGVVASRKVGDAVRRARAKRRLREAFRLNRDRFRGPCDVILIARGGLLTAPWSAVNAELLGLAAQAGLLRESPREGKAG